MWVGCVCTNTNIHKPTHLQTQTQGVTLPDAIANAILDTQSIKEQINAASNAKDTAAVNAQTSVYNAELDAAVTLYTAEVAHSLLCNDDDDDGQRQQTTHR